MKRSTFSYLAVLVLLSTMALSACKPKTRVLPASKPAITFTQPPRVMLMPEKSGENHRCYTDLPDGTVRIDVALLDGTFGEMRCLNGDRSRLVVLSAREVQPDKKSVTYKFKPNSNIIESVSYFREDGTLHAVRTWQGDVIVHTFYRADGATLFGIVEEGGEDLHKTTLWQPDGVNLRGVIESHGEAKNLLFAYDLAGKQVYRECALANDSGGFTLTCELFKDGVLSTRDSWVSDIEQESGLTPLVLEKFENGKLVLTITPASTDQESGDVETWNATTLNEKGLAVGTKEVTNLDEAGFPESANASVKGIARKLAEEAEDLLIELADHSEHFQRF